MIKAMAGGWMDGMNSKASCGDRGYLGNSKGMRNGREIGMALRSGLGN